MNIFSINLKVVRSLSWNQANRRSRVHLSKPTMKGFSFFYETERTSLHSFLLYRAWRKSIRICVESISGFLQVQDKSCTEIIIHVGLKMLLLERRCFLLTSYLTGTPSACICMRTLQITAIIRGLRPRILAVTERIDTQHNWRGLSSACY